MKIVEIVPRARTRLYGTLVAKEAAIRKSGRGTYVRVGRTSQRAARWKHKKFKGTLQLNRDASERVTAKVRASTPEDERKLLSILCDLTGVNFGCAEGHCAGPYNRPGA